MQTRKLGSQGLTVSALGLGCAGMSMAYGVPDDVESVATLHRAVELGLNFFDSATSYGPFTNEVLLGNALKSKRGQVVIATKFGFNYDVNGRVTGPNSKPEAVTKSVEDSLKRLGTDYIDLLYQHRLDPQVPIEETVGAMARLIEQGKARYLGLCEAGIKTIRRAHATHPISALQSEYSLWERNLEPEILPVLRELGIGLVTFSPLGRSFLTGKAPRPEDTPASDLRRYDPRFQGENFDRNMFLVDEIGVVAKAKNATASQIALAWILHQGADIVPIPGTKRRVYLEENLGAASIMLTEAELTRLSELGASGTVAGPRYADMKAAMIDR